MPGYEEIYVISNLIENGVAIGALGAGEASWHTDMSFLPDPPLGSVLYSLEVPPSGGDTWFLNMVMAYQALPADLRARVDGLSLKHDSTTNSGGSSATATSGRPIWRPLPARSTLLSSPTPKAATARSTWVGG